MFCAKFGWNWPSGPGEVDENEKFTDRQTNNKRSEKLTWAHKNLLNMYKLPSFN